MLNLEDEPLPPPPPGYEEIHHKIQREREERVQGNEILAKCLQLLTKEKSKTPENPVRGVLRKIPDGLSTLPGDYTYVSFVKWCEQTGIFFDKIGKEGKTYFEEILQLVESTMKIRASTSQMDLHGIWPGEHVISVGEVHDSLEAYTRHALVKAIPSRIMNIAIDNRKTRVVDILYIARYTVAYENNFAQLRIMRDKLLRPTQCRDVSTLEDMIHKWKIEPARFISLDFALNKFDTFCGLEYMILPLKELEIPYNNWKMMNGHKGDYEELATWLLNYIARCAKRQVAAGSSSSKPFKNRLSNNRYTPFRGKTEKRQFEQPGCPRCTTTKT